MKRLTAVAALLLVAASISGCDTLREEHRNIQGREENVTNVIGNVWRIDAKWPGVKESRELADHLYQRAREHCEKGRFGMLPLSGAVHDGSGDAAKPAEGWLEFRCQSSVHVQEEYKGITLHLDLEELEGDER